MKKIYLLFSILFMYAGFNSAQLMVADKTGWTIVHANRVEHAAVGAIDGDYSSAWLTHGTTDNPRDIIVDMGAVYTDIPAFLYIARDGNRTKGYEIYFAETLSSTDIDDVQANTYDWGTAAVIGEFLDKADMQVVTLPANTSARYFRFVGTSAHDSWNRVSAAELGIAQNLDITNKYNLSPSTDPTYYLERNEAGHIAYTSYKFNTVLDSADDDFWYTFVPVPGKPCTYYIKIGANYLISSGVDCDWQPIHTTPEYNQIIIESGAAGISMRPVFKSNNPNNRFIGYDVGDLPSSGIYGNFTYANRAFFTLKNPTPVVLPVEFFGKSPAENATNVLETAPITVTFNQNITLSASPSVTIVDGGGSPVGGISASASGMTLTITHAVLAGNTTYTVTIPAGTVVGYDTALSWSFTTRDIFVAGTYNILNLNVNGGLGSTVYMEWNNTYPEAGASQFVVAEQQFAGERAAKQTFILTVPDPNEPDVFYIQESHSNRYMYQGGNYWNLFTSDTPAGDKYKFKIEKDGSGYRIRPYTDLTRSIGAQTADGTGGIGGYRCQPNTGNNPIWAFEVPSTSSELLLVSKSPAADATGVLETAAITATFNQNITLNGAIATTISIEDENEQAVSGVSASVLDNVLTIAHAVLDGGKTYTVTIPAGTVEGYNTALIWSFTTRNMLAAGVYNIVNAHAGFGTDAYMTIGEYGGADANTEVYLESKATSGADVEKQKFELIIPDSNYPDTYIIQSVSTKKYLYRNGWAVRTREILENSNSEKVTITEESGAYRITSLSGSSIGSRVYQKMAFFNIGENELWKFEPTTTGPSTSEKIISNSKALVYPTLSKGFITVQTPEVATISIVDVSGKKLASYVSAGDLSINLNYVDGLYFVVVNTEQGNSVHKIMLNK